MAAAGAEPALGPERRYQLVRQIAAGGMGEVWEADDVVLGRRVALKVLTEDLAADERAARRFTREARATARLVHPNVARVYDFSQDRRSPFLVMELLEGETLAGRLAGGPLPPAEAARIAATVADALDAAHSSGIVHRDVKPSNVMLTPEGEVKVLDFGIAAAADEATSTSSGGMYATASYVSPERAAGRPATPASDVYSLGAVLYELLTGRPPFEGGSALDLAKAHLTERPRPVREVAPWVSAALAGACEAALAKNPAERPSSAAAFAARLRSAAKRAGRQPPTTQPGRPAATGALGGAEEATLDLEAVRRGRRRARRRPALVLLAGTLVLLLGVVGGLELADRRAGPTTPIATRAPASATAAGPAAAAAPVTLTVRATARVWARVRVNGTVAFEDILDRGESRSFTGRQVQLRLGNAGSVRLSLDGRNLGAPGPPGAVWEHTFAAGRPAP